MNSDVEESIDTSSVDHCSDAADEKYMELYKLCLRCAGSSKKRSFVKVQDWLEENKGNQKLLESAANYKDEFNATPLHFLLSSSYVPSELVERFIQLAPDIFKVQSAIDGLFPLHMVCQGRLSHDSSDIISMLLQAYPEAAGVKDNAGYLPLHCVCYSTYCLDAIKLLVEAYPEGARVQDSQGNLPLHRACQNRATAESIRVLLAAYPNSAAVQNKFGQSPLHKACENCTGDKESLDRLHILLEACPESINMKDEDNTRPSGYLKKNWRGGYYGAKNDLILHNTIIGKFSPCLVKLILEAFPEKCMEQDNRGMIPLHYASVSRAPHFFKYVVALLEAGSSADGLIVQDKKGRTPWQILKRRACKRDKNKRLPLHRMAASSDNLSEKSLKLFVDAYPEGIATTDKYGMLPFHCACLNPTSSVEVLWTFLNLCPEVIGFSEIIKKKRKISQKCCKNKSPKVK